MQDNARRFSTYAASCPAGDRVDIDRPGSYFRLIEGGAGLKVRIDDEPPGEISVGLGVSCPEPFKRLTIINETGAAIAFEIAIARGRVDDSRLSLSTELSIATPSVLGDAPDVALAAATPTLIAAANSARKEIIVSNLATNAAAVRIGSASVGAARGVEVSPGQTITLNTTAAVYGYSVPGESVAVVEVET